MYKTIKGRYENGKVILEEQPPVKTAEVIVVFTNEGTEEKKVQRIAGFSKGSFGKLPLDFNEPLEDLKDYM